MEENKAILAELFQRIKKAASTTPYNDVLGENAIAEYNVHEEVNSIRYSYIAETAMGSLVFDSAANIDTEPHYLFVGGVSVVNPTDRSSEVLFKAITDEFHPAGVDHKVDFVETSEDPECIASTTLLLEYDAENPNWHVTSHY